MKEEQTSEGATRPPGESSPDGSRGLRELFVFRAGARRFAVFREEVEDVGAGLRPAPLPFAPPAVLGVVSLRGRVRTALDPLKLMPAPPAAPNETPPASDETLHASDKASSASDEASHASSQPPHASAQPPRLFVALAGDEQLALACDAAEEPFTISPDELRPAADTEAPTRGLVTHDAHEVTLLDPARLFDAAMRGRDRRRRRT